MKKISLVFVSLLILCTGCMQNDYEETVKDEDKPAVEEMDELHSFYISLEDEQAKEFEMFVNEMYSEMKQFIKDNPFLTEDEILSEGLLKEFANKYLLTKDERFAYDFYHYLKNCYDGYDGKMDNVLVYPDKTIYDYVIETNVPYYTLSHTFKMMYNWNVNEDMFDEVAFDGEKISFQVEKAEISDQSLEVLLYAGTNLLLSEDIDMGLNQFGKYVRCMSIDDMDTNEYSKQHYGDEVHFEENDPFGYYYSEKHGFFYESEETFKKIKYGKQIPSYIVALKGIYPDTYPLMKNDMNLAEYMETYGGHNLELLIVSTDDGFKLMDTKWIRWPIDTMVVLDSVNEEEIGKNLQG